MKMSTEICLLARLLGSFVLYTNRLARDNGQEKVYYLSREGRFFLALHCRLAEIRTFDLLPARHIEASRMSTFLASLPYNPTANDFEHYLWQFGLPNLETFVRGTGLAWPDDVSHYLARFPNLDVHCQQLSNPTDRLSMLLDHEKFRAALSAMIKRRHRELVGYLDTLGIPDQGMCMVADIGWAGSIENNLAHALPNINWRGAYLYLRPSAQISPVNSHKCGFLFDGRASENYALERTMRFVKPLELMTTAPGGSAIGYLRDEKGRIEPHFLLGSDEQSLNDYWVPIQRAILQAIPTQIKYLAFDDDTRNLLTQQLKKLLHHPSEQLAKAYLLTPREEEFGAGKTHPPIADGFFEQANSHLFKRLIESNWPHAVLVATISPHWLARLSLLLFDMADGARSLVYRLVWKGYRGIIRER